MKTKTLTERYNLRSRVQYTSPVYSRFDTDIKNLKYLLTM
jgi:hypothetical protein